MASLDSTRATTSSTALRPAPRAAGHTMAAKDNGASAVTTVTNAARTTSSA